DVQFHRHEGAGRDLRGHADQRRTPGREPPERDHRGAPRDRAVAGHEDPAAVRPLEGARWDDDHRRGTPSHARLADGRRRSKGGTMAANMADLLQILVDRGGSDLHITSGTYPQLRITGRLTQLTQFEQLTPQDTQRLAYSILNETQKQKFEEESELDLSFGIQGLARFRCNVFRQRGAVGAAIRLIPYKIRSFDELGLPPIVQQLAERPKGLILVTGPTGSGKSTTLAAMIDKVNTERHEHIVTIEDPIEFVHPHKSCLVNQREVYSDTHSFQKALKSILRQDPDVVLVGEMRDLETISAALTIAETGHLTFATLHTNSCAQTMNRIIVCAQEFVCSVANVRWPVSAIVSAAEIVSRSRISPTSTTSGSCRRMDLSALWNDCVSEYTSRWLTRHDLCGCTNSIGSSIVTMCSWRSVLTLSISAASVVDFPEPVGPVTRISPFGRSASCWTIGGSPSSSNERILYGMRRIAAPTAPRWRNTLQRKRASPWMPNERSSSFSSSNFCFCVSLRMLYASRCVSCG